MQELSCLLLFLNLQPNGKHLMTHYWVTTCTLKNSVLECHLLVSVLHPPSLSGKVCAASSIVKTEAKNVFSFSISSLSFPFIPLLSNNPVVVVPKQVSYF